MTHGFLPFTILMILLAVVIAPIVEELIFRGLFSRWLMPKSAVWIRATVSSFVFALIHAVKPLEILMYTILGLGLYMAYQRRQGQIKDSILLHVCNNIPLGIIYLLQLF